MKGREGERPRGVRDGRSELLRTGCVVGVHLLGLPVALRWISDVQLPTSGCRSVARSTLESSRRVELVPGWVVDWCLGVAHSRTRRARLGVGDGFVELEVGNRVEPGVGDVSGSGSSLVGLGISDGDRGGVGVEGRLGVGDVVGLDVGYGVGVVVGRGVGLGVGVGAGNCVGDGVGAGIGVGVGDVVEPNVGDTSSDEVGLGDALGVGFEVGDGVDDGYRVWLDADDGVDDSVGTEIGLGVEDSVGLGLDENIGDGGELGVVLEV